MTVLALDTATEVLSLAAQRDEAWAALSVRRGLQHSPALLGLAERVLADVGAGPADLTLIVCSLGPGSFTGIRIGLATALGIGHAREIPVVGVSTLDALALPWEAWDGEVFPVLDARKGRYYTAPFVRGARQGDYRDSTAAELGELLRAARHALLVGPDAHRIAGQLGEAAAGVEAADTVDPRSLLRLGLQQYTKEGVRAGEPLQPLYLRKSEAETKAEENHHEP